jgi:hypothetical protein
MNTISAAQWVEAFEELYSYKSVASAPPSHQNTPYPAPIMTNSLSPRHCENTSTPLNVEQSPLDADISEEEVMAALGKLRSKNAPGIDGISAELLKSAIDVMVTPLTGLFNHMFEGRFPQCLSTGVIDPIFKKGVINDPLNYRGITICSSISKLYASVLDNRIHDWAECSGIRIRGQAGFRRGGVPLTTYSYSGPS